MSKIRPLGDRVVVRQSEEEEKTSTGIVLPDTAKKKPQEGEVIAVGPGRQLDNGTRVAPGVKVGDKVIYAQYSGMEIKVDGEEYVVLFEGDILGIKE